MSTLFLFIFFIFSNSVFSQSWKDSKPRLQVETSTTDVINHNNSDLIKQFNRDLEKNLEASNNRNWNVALDMTYPKLFDYATKEDIVAQFESVFIYYKNMQLEASNIRHSYPIIEHEGMKFTRFSYDSKITFTLYDEDSLDDMYSTFRDTYGKNNVQANHVDNSIIINLESYMLAVLQDNSSEWKYLQWNDVLFDNFDDFIPSVVLKGLKK